jgi:molecular chaperone GrpE
LHWGPVGNSSQGVSNDPAVENPDLGGEAASPEAPVELVDPVAEAEKRAATLKDQLLRTAADFDNYRKRARREVEEAGVAGRDSLLREMLPVFDNLERATGHLDSAAQGSALASGIEMVIRQFKDTLKKLGIERVETIGRPFDPALHEALQQIETPDFQPGHIAAEIQGGYRFGERLIRPAMVVVAKAPSASAPETQH